LKQTINKAGRKIIETDKYCDKRLFSGAEEVRKIDTAPGGKKEKKNN